MELARVVIEGRVRWSWLELSKMVLSKMVLSAIEASGRLPKHRGHGNGGGVVDTVGDPQRAQPNRDTGAPRA